MAKAGTWLRGARGKLAGMVLSKGEGYTLQRDLVIPSNPRTPAQMRTRAAFSVVSKAGAQLAQLVGISFQGETKITKSKRRFRSANMSMLINMLKNNAASVTLAPKGFSVLIPNAYVVSHGSIANATLGDIQANGTTFSQTSHVFQLEADVNYSPSQILKTVFGCKPGDQITMVGIYTGYPINEYEDVLQILRESEMRSARVCFKTENELQAESIDWFSISQEDTPQQIAQAMQEYLTDLIDFSKSNGKFMQLITISDGYVPVVSEGVATFTWDVETATDSNYNSLGGLAGEESACMALGYFHSHYNDNSALWEFSRCQLKTISPLYTRDSFNNDLPVNYGCSLDVVLRSYANSENSSSRYTETGGPDNDINF